MTMDLQVPVARLLSRRDACASVLENEKMLGNLSTSLLLYFLNFFFFSKLDCFVEKYCDPRWFISAQASKVAKCKDVRPLGK